MNNLKNNINTFLILGILFIVSGCASPKIRITPDIESKLKNRTFAVVTRFIEYDAMMTGPLFNPDAPDWLYQYNGNQSIMRGHDIIERYNMTTPQERLAEAVSKLLQQKYGMEPIAKEMGDPAPVYYDSDSGGKSFYALLSHYLTKADYVVNIQGFVNSMNTFQFNRYTVTLHSHLSIWDKPDLKSKQVLNDSCLTGPTPGSTEVNLEYGLVTVSDETEPMAPTYKEMLDDDARLLKSMFQTMGDRCIEYYRDYTLSGNSRK